MLSMKRMEYILVPKSKDDYNLYVQCKKAGTSIPKKYKHFGLSMRLKLEENLINLSKLIKSNYKLFGFYLKLVISDVVLNSY